jgi:hypothetical protein
MTPRKKQGHGGDSLWPRCNQKSRRRDCEWQCWPPSPRLVLLSAMALRPRRPLLAEPPSGVAGDGAAWGDSDGHVSPVGNDATERRAARETALPNVSKVPVGAGRGKQPPSVRRFRECPLHDLRYQGASAFIGEHMARPTLHPRPLALSLLVDRL